jgi:hypothetical protein
VNGWNDGGNIRWELPLCIARKICSEAFGCVPFKIKESFFGTSRVDDDDAETDGYSWIVSETVDEEVLVERESERDEHRRCLFVTDFWVEDNDGGAGVGSLEDIGGWGLCHRRCEAKLAGQLNVLSHSGQLNEMKNLVLFENIFIKTPTEIQYVQLLDIYA